MTIPPAPPAVLELTEAEAMFQVQAAAPAHVRALLGMDATRIGGAVVTAMREDPTRYWSKVIGLGFEQPITTGLIGEVCDFYRSRDTFFATFQPAPGVLPPDWADICAAYGITAGSSWVKLAHSLTGIRPAETDLRIERVGAEHAAEWGSLLVRGFGMPEEGLASMSAGIVTHPGFVPYAAWDGDRMVAVGDYFVHGDAAEGFGAATLPEYRGRGAQSAILARALGDAAAAGCRYFVAETGSEAPGEHNPSLHNMLRAGFQVCYERRNWVWQAPPAGA
jgi:GNAT superfamily N-acetyltransferase